MDYSAININSDLHYPFHREDFPWIGSDEPWLVHTNYSNRTKGPSHIMHRHNDRAEVLVLLNGSGEYTISGRKYDLSAGDVVVCNPGIMHDEFPVINSKYDSMTIGIAGLKTETLPDGFLIEPSLIPVFRKSGETEELCTLFLMLLSHSSPGEQQNLRLCHHLMLACAEIIRLLAGRAEQSNRVINPLCLQAEAWLDEHFMEEVTLEDLAAQLFVSPWHLSRLFKEETSYNFKEYLLRLRLGESQSRLAFTDDSVTEIAYACGFNDPAYFTRAFKKLIGMSPAGYRKFRKAPVTKM